MLNFMFCFSDFNKNIHKERVSKNIQFMKNVVFSELSPVNTSATIAYNVEIGWKLVENNVSSPTTKASPRCSMDSLQCKNSFSRSHGTLFTPRKCTHLTYLCNFMTIIINSTTVVFDFSKSKICEKTRFTPNNFIKFV